MLLPPRPACRRFLVLGLAMVLVACATPIAQTLQIRYTGNGSSGQATGRVVGLQALQDRRTGVDPFQIGFRDLGGGRQERYLSGARDVATAVTAAVEELARRRGLRTESIRAWDFTPAAMAGIAQGRDFVVGGVIEKLSCQAVKQAFRTEATVEARLILYLGKVDTGIVHRRPVDIRLERVDVRFESEKAESFLNQVLGEALEKGLSDLI
jgi:hypothetical protein